MIFGLIQFLKLILKVYIEFYHDYYDSCKL